MKVDYVTHMGDDLLVVNAARVSFKKFSDEFKDSDEKLVRYLATHGHWTPFAHPQICLRMTAPVFIRTQCFKHKQGFVENEVSRRYVDDAPEFFVPSAWRGKPTGGAKQGSSDTEVKTFVFKGTVEAWETEVNDVYYGLLNAAQQLYDSMIAAGIAPEQARMVLPQSMLTEWIWTGSLAAYARFYKQRMDPHAQKEIQELATMVGEIIEPLFPVCWRELVD